MLLFPLQIYYRNSVLSQDEQLSDTGEAWVIYNGIPDWVFEEEVFEDNRALWWSPDATKLVWGSFNDSEVKTYLLGKLTPTLKELYTSMAKILGQNGLTISCFPDSNGMNK